LEAVPVINQFVFAVLIVVTQLNNAPTTGYQYPDTKSTRDTMHTFELTKINFGHSLFSSRHED
jgi:hypothetical protein